MKKLFLTTCLLLFIFVLPIYAHSDHLWRKELGGVMVKCTLSTTLNDKQYFGVPEQYINYGDEGKFFKNQETGHYIYNDTDKYRASLGADGFRIGIYEKVQGSPYSYPLSSLALWNFTERRTAVLDLGTLSINYNLDYDNDGVTVGDEMSNFTNPFYNDTDDDNLGDNNDINGVDIQINIDGEASQTINTSATDPLNPDSDNDGVLDGIEVYGLAPYGFVTDPNNPDTDGDGVIDGQDSNPLGITDANGDGIADEWVDFWQNQISQWGYSSSWLTSIENPNADTDGDGISNRDEYENGTVPIVPNGHFETRVRPSPLEISANVDEIVTAEFNVVDLSFQPSTGEVFQLHQPWVEKIHAVPENLKLKYLSTNEWYEENLPARFCSRFGIQNKFQFVINTTNLANNTTYKDKIIVVTGGATDDDSGDIITYEVRCSAFHFTGAPNTMAADVNQTTIQAVGWEEGLNDKLEYQRKYEWQIVARDNSGAAAFSPIWSFVTLPSNYVDVIILSDSLRKGYIGRSYKEQLIAAYGFPPYQWQILSGNLPVGLLLKTDGTVYGEPTATGNYTFEVETEDWAGGKTNTAINLEIGTTGSGDAGSMGYGAAGHGNF